MSAPVHLRRLARTDLRIVEPWFEDSETSRYLGGRDWPGRMLDLDGQVIGTEFRGATQTGAFRFLASHEGRPVGMIDCGVFDRWVEWGGEDASGPIIGDSLEVTTGSIAFVTDPTQRGQGLGRSMIGSLVSWSELSDVRIFEAGVEPENVPSIRCLSAAGFQLHRGEPDYEGMLYYLLKR
jgi:RimJ/RimL family protein N-acetyltransferase